MPEHAKVTSVDAIEAFRAKLIVYREKAARVLDEISSEVTRTRIWLQQDQVNRVDGEIRQCQRKLSQLQQELFTARIAITDNVVDVKQGEVRRARNAMRDQEAKLLRVRKWGRAFDQRVEAPARQVEKLRHVVDKDLGQAVAFLNEVTKTLNAYMELSARPTQPKRPEPEPPA
jgi:hypothetical protein